MEANPDPVVVYDMEGKVIYFDPAFARVFGWSLEECLGMKLDMFVPEENRPETMMMIKKMQAGERFSGIETRRYTKKRDTIPVSISGSTYRDRDANPVGSINTLRDISEQKKLEAQLQRAQKMEAIGTLAGGVAHDLNNILAGLVSYPELLLVDIPEDSPLRKPVLTIKKSGEKAAAIVQDLLTLARRGVPATEVMNLNDIISEYLKGPEHERLKLYHAEVQVETNLEADLLNIFGSPVHLSKTVMNLVSNAAEAMPDGGTISISTENRYVDSPIKGYDNVAEGDYVTLTVSDTGVGISREDRERIFEPFYTKKAMGRSGTGLGMAVVWGTVKDHKGYIDVESAKGKGATFTLYFPVSRKELTRDKSILSIEDYRGKGESILVVDDVEEQREIASRILKKLGYSVTTVSNGEEAVDYLKNNSTNLLVLDMIMDPGIDGYETYKRILEFHPNQKAIIVSGFSETKRVKRAQRLGAGAYIKKPFLLEKIGLAVRDELEK
jgi:PAS domain S-box-containing protein